MPPFQGKVSDLLCAGCSYIVGTYDRQGRLYVECAVGHTALPPADGECKDFNCSDGSPEEEVK